jgi:hypothetical protein
MNIGAISSRAADSLTRGPVGKGITRLAQACEGSKVFEKLATEKNLKTAKKWMPGVFGLWISAYYVMNNLKSDKIPKERKTPLAINDLINTTFGFFGGLLLSDKILAFKDAMLDNFRRANAGMDPTKLKVLDAGMSTMIPLMGFALMFRYFGPVIATPLADKVNRFLIKKGIIKDPEKAQKEKQNQVAMTGNKTPAAQPGANLNVNSAASTQGSQEFNSFLKQVGFQAKNSFIA